MAANTTKLPKGALSPLAKLTSRALVAVVGGLFLVDLAIPDAIPFLDEIFLGVATLLLARWQARRENPPQPTPAPAAKPPRKNITPS